MKRQFFAASVSLVLACGSDESLSSSESPSKGSQTKPPRDASVGEGGGKADAGAGKDELDEVAPLPETDFAQCAVSRTEAERGPAASNVVWVVDTSGSMDEEAAIVQQNLNTFVESTVHAGLSDYRVVVVSERKFIDVPDPLRSDAEHFLYVEEEVGSKEPLEDLLTRFSSYGDFLLPNVMTHFVVVTDDESRVSAASFIEQMDAKLAGGFRVHAIASPPSGSGSGTMPDPANPLSWLNDLIGGDGCTGPYGDASRAGAQNFQAAVSTEGLSFSICADDWTPLFSQLAENVSTSAVPCSLELPSPQSGKVDVDLVNVVFTPPSGGTGGTIPRRTAASTCGNQQGWYYDDPDQPARIELCPSSCSAASQGGTLDIALGCVTVIAQ